jgi:hypothetical protein
MRYLPLKLAALCVLLSACVTINVYFPAAAAEKAADRIIEDVWGSDARNSNSNKRTELRNLQPEQVLLAAAGAVLDLIVPAAHAQADLNIATPVVKQLTASMEARHAQLKKYYDSGCAARTQCRAQARGRRECRSLEPVSRDRQCQRPS